MGDSGEEKNRVENDGAVAMMSSLSVSRMPVKVPGILYILLKVKIHQSCLLMIKFAKKEDGYDIWSRGLHGE